MRTVRTTVEVQLFSEYVSVELAAISDPLSDGADAACGATMHFTTGDMLGDTTYDMARHEAYERQLEQARDRQRPESRQAVPGLSLHEVLRRRLAAALGLVRGDVPIGDLEVIEEDGALVRRVTLLKHRLDTIDAGGMRLGARIVAALGEAPATHTDDEVVQKICELVQKAKTFIVAGDPADPQTLAAARGTAKEYRKLYNDLSENVGIALGWSNATRAVTDDSGLVQGVRDLKTGLLEAKGAWGDDRRRLEALEGELRTLSAEFVLDPTSDAVGAVGAQSAEAIIEMIEQRLKLHRESVHQQWVLDTLSDFDEDLEARWKKAKTEESGPFLPSAEAYMRGQFETARDAEQGKARENLGAEGIAHVRAKAGLRERAEYAEAELKKLASPVCVLDNKGQPRCGDTSREQVHAELFHQVTCADCLRLCVVDLRDQLTESEKTLVEYKKALTASEEAYEARVVATCDGLCNKPTGPHDPSELMPVCHRKMHHRGDCESRITWANARDEDDALELPEMKLAVEEWRAWAWEHFEGPCGSLRFSDALLRKIVSSLVRAGVLAMNQVDADVDQRGDLPAWVKEVVELKDHVQKDARLVLLGREHVEDAPIGSAWRPKALGGSAWLVVAHAEPRVTIETTGDGAQRASTTLGVSQLLKFWTRLPDVVKS